jgi:hypothetical protein
MQQLITLFQLRPGQRLLIDQTGNPGEDFNIASRPLKKPLLKQLQALMELFIGYTIQEGFLTVLFQACVALFSSKHVFSTTAIQRRASLANLEP